MAFSLAVCCCAAKQGQQVLPENATREVSADAININTALAVELERLPGIGKTLAARIVEFREANGPFRRPEQLMLVQGFSDKRFRDIRGLIRTE